VIDTGIHLGVGHKPAEELPLHEREVRTGLDRAHETQRPFLGLLVRKALKDAVFQAR
jgi:hypothetical protein